MAGWNFAELWEAIADKFPDAQAQVQGEKRFTWREFDSRSDALAHHLTANQHIAPERQPG